MQLVGGQFVCSPSDLANFIACEHLTQLELTVALGEATRPSFGNAYADLIKRKGEEHERGFLEALRAAGYVVTQIGLGEDRDLAAAAKATADAIASGSEYIYQAVFLADGWHGIADFRGSTGPPRLVRGATRSSIRRPSAASRSAHHEMAAGVPKNWAEG